MAKFKQVPQSFMFRKLVKYSRNMVKNFDSDCRDNDFFDVVRNCFDHDKAVELIEAAYSAKELEEMSKAKSRSCRLDLSDPLDEVFCALWNTPGSRGKCRAVLEAVFESMESDCSDGSRDMIARRFAELKRVLKLNDLEMEILVFAYVRDQTCFAWPVRIEDREKPLHYAMALDRSYAEVVKALSPDGAILKFNLLDNDYDFSRRTLGGYLDGTTDETIERRFYTKTDFADVLPWDYYGELSKGDGEVLKKMLSGKVGKCNILLYGAPGTGKTSFARSLAKELGRTAFEVKQGDEDGKNMKAEARMVGIKVCNTQEDASDSMMIVDEADELLRGSSCGFSLFGFDFGGGKSTEKGVMNTLLQVDREGRDEHPPRRDEAPGGLDFQRPRLGDGRVRAPPLRLLHLLRAPQRRAARGHLAQPGREARARRTHPRGEDRRVLREVRDERGRNLHRAREREAHGSRRRQG